jgi:hypothetical protein
MDVDDDAPRAAFEVDGDLDPALGTLILHRFYPFQFAI